MCQGRFFLRVDDLDCLGVLIDRFSDSRRALVTIRPIARGTLPVPNHFEMASHLYYFRSPSPRRGAPIPRGDRRIQ